VARSIYFVLWLRNIFTISIAISSEVKLINI
jgi:hypothetical protein